MSWHTNAILIHADLSKDYLGLLKRLGLNGAEAGEPVSFEEASSAFNDNVAIGTLDGWTALWGNLALYMVDDAGLARIAKKADVFQMILEGTSGTAGFTWYTGGKLVRDWLRQAGEMIKNEGKPLPQEKKAFAKQDDEQAVLQLLTTLTLPFPKLEAMAYQMYEIPEE